MGDLHIDFAGLGTGEPVSVQGSVHEAEKKIQNLIHERKLHAIQGDCLKKAPAAAPHFAPSLLFDVLLVSRLSQARHARQAVSFLSPAHQ